MKRDRMVFLRHMLICIDRIADYTRDGRTVFMADPKTQDAVVRNLEGLGQAAKDVGTEVRALGQELESMRPLIAEEARDTPQHT